LVISCQARVRVAQVSDGGKADVEVVGVAALVGGKRSFVKARASSQRPTWGAPSEGRDPDGSGEGVALTTPGGADVRVRSCAPIRQPV
jgi:hypothetical protein